MLTKKREFSHFSGRPPFELDLSKVMPISSNIDTIFDESLLILCEELQILKPKL